MVVEKRIRKGSDVTILVCIFWKGSSSSSFLLTNHFVLLLLALHDVMLGADELARVAEALAPVGEVEGGGVAGRTLSRD